MALAKLMVRGTMSPTVTEVGRLDVSMVTGMRMTVWEVERVMVFAFEISVGGYLAVRLLCYL